MTLWRWEVARALPLNTCPEELEKSRCFLLPGGSTEATAVGQKDPFQEPGALGSSMELHEGLRLVRRTLYSHMRSSVRV